MYVDLCVREILKFNIVVLDGTSQQIYQVLE